MDPAACSRLAPILTMAAVVQDCRSGSVLVLAVAGSHRSGAMLAATHPRGIGGSSSWSSMLAAARCRGNSGSSQLHMLIVVVAVAHALKTVTGARASKIVAVNEASSNDSWHGLGEHLWWCMDAVGGPHRCVQWDPSMGSMFFLIF